MYKWPFRIHIILIVFPSFQGQVMFRNGERMGTIKFNQFQGMWDTAAMILILN